MNPGPSICPNCSISLEKGLKFCPNCGAALSGPKNGALFVLARVFLALAALGFAASGACFVGFGAFGFDNRDVGFPPSASTVLLGLFLQIIAGACLYALFRLNRRHTP